MASVSDIFGIETDSQELYQYALTHSSYTKEKELPPTQCYERLEFLGDAVLKLTISDVLFKKYPEASEGELSKIRGILVSDNTLAEIAKTNGLQDLIIMSRHDEKQGHKKLNSICACVFEAVLGAYYLDGKFDKIVQYIQRTFEPYIDDVQEHFVKFNAKAVLQEYTQSINKKTPVYTVINTTGPAHKTEFEIEVRFNDEVLAVEKGSSKKEAEQKCAYAACEKLGII
ncbi:MAG: ribonuclease III [Cyanobacteria bacterium SIG26]|nr:ribonuclease III [Cyanobacteria bacterium SIG26]